MGKITLNQDSLRPRREFKRHQIQPGSNIYRILPPFGDEATHNNYPYRKWSVVWMADPESGRRRPFALPPFEKGKMDPVSDYIKQLQDRIDQVKAALLAKGMTEEQTREKLKDLNDVVWQLRPKHGFYYNAVNKAGEVGILELRKTAHDALKREMFQYIKDYSQDPTSLDSADDDSGVWFDIHREGEKGDKNTEYLVKKSQVKVKKPTGGFAWEDDRAALPEHVSQNYNSLGYDLQALYQMKTHEELYALLLANLAEIVEKVPMARIAGFDPADLPAAPLPIQEMEIPFEPAPVVKPAKAPVKLALDISEEEDFSSILGTPQTVTHNTVVPTKLGSPIITKAKPTPVDNDDVFAMAESILNG